MTPDNHSAHWVPVHVHAPLTFDMSPEQPVAGPLGKSHVPVTILPRLQFDFGQQEETPVLRLTLYLRPDANPAQVTLDVLEFIDALGRFEQQLGGHGLTWNKAQSRAEPNRGVVHLVLEANDRSDAQERLSRLAASATTDSNQASLTVEGAKASSIARWEASVGNKAA